MRQGGLQVRSFGKMDSDTGLAAWLYQYQDYIAGLVGLAAALAVMLVARFGK